MSHSLHYHVVESLANPGTVSRHTVSFSLATAEGVVALLLWKHRQRGATLQAVAPGLYEVYHAGCLYARIECAPCTRADWESAPLVEPLFPLAALATWEAPHG